MTSRPRRVFIGLPAYNEEVALPRLLQRIERLIASSGETATTVLYNDGCTDKTVPIAQGWQERLPLVILGCARNKGLGAGLRALVAYAVATGHDDDVLVIMDCDDTHDPCQIGEILGAMAGGAGAAGGAEVVVASRFTRGALVRGVPFLRRVTALGAMVLFKLIHPVRGVWDYTCGYRGYRIGALKVASARYGAGLIRESGFACMVELLLKLNTLGLRFAEVPLQLRYDQKPTASKMDVGGNLRRLLILLVRWRVRGFAAL
jgi:dolichol-phosphate mannosyltransferase